MILAGMLLLPRLATTPVGLAFAGQAESSPQQDSTTTTDLALAVQEGRLSLRARNASLKAILEEIGRRLAIEVMARIPADERVTSPSRIELGDARDESRAAAELEYILCELSWVRTNTRVLNPSVRLTVRRRERGYGIPPTAGRVFHAEGFCGWQSGDDFYPIERTSRWRLQLRQGQGEAWLAADFDRNPPRLRRSSWVFGLLKLLRPFRFFSLHAAAVISPTGEAIVIVGQNLCAREPAVASLSAPLSPCRHFLKA